MTHQFTLTIQVQHAVTRAGNVTRRDALVYAVHIQVQIVVLVHQDSDRLTNLKVVQVRPIVLLYLKIYVFKSDIFLSN